MNVRLADFILSSIEPILVEWEAFARSIWPPTTAPSPRELRDSAEEILRAVVADMGTLQNLHEQLEKSQGRGVGGAKSDRLDHASQVHGTDRAGSGLSLAAVLAEYRSLRAAVLRLWRASKPDPDRNDLDDVTRFNEAIDQSLALAVTSFTGRLDKARNIFLGILGHDLRNPLSAITVTAKLASMNCGQDSEIPGQLEQIVISATAISELVTNLIDFARSSLGAGLPLEPAAADLHVLCDEVARELRAAHPGRRINLNVGGDLAGTWDRHRLRQMIANLVGNALQHGSAGEPVDLTADGTDPQSVVLRVHNGGEPIPANVLPTIFDPLTRGPASVQRRHTPGSIGLGLYIVREIATSHGGSVELISTADAGTTAIVRLPRHAAPRHAS
jgi:signal transduction histidine kinase